MARNRHFLVFLYVAVVIDTDGSAFITKAEFDSLKNNFQAQIDNYNSSIDSKIDGAIAAYLSGVRVSTETILDNLYANIGSNVTFSNNSWLVASDKKNYFNVFVNMLLMRDGYYGYDAPATQGNVTAWGMFQFTNDTDTGTWDSTPTSWSNGAGKYNIGTHDENSKPLVQGYVTNEYIASYYTFSGCSIGWQGFNTQGSESWIGWINDGDEFSNRALENDITSRPHIYDAAMPELWYKFTPKTAGWGVKNTYWARTDTYINGTTTNRNIQLACSLDGSDIGFIDVEDRGAGDSDATKFLYPEYSTGNFTFKNSFKVATQYTNNIAKLGFRNYGFLWLNPKVYKHKNTDLLSSKLTLGTGIEVKLTDGIPFFRTTSDGRLRFSCRTIGAGTLGFKDGPFENADNINCANVAFKVCPDTTVFDPATATGPVTQYTFANSKYYAIEMEVDTNKIYYFKCHPSTASAGLYYNSFSDLSLSSEN